MLSPTIKSICLTVAFTSQVTIQNFIKVNNLRKEEGSLNQFQEISMEPCRIRVNPPSMVIEVIEMITLRILTFSLPANFCLILTSRRLSMVLLKVPSKLIN